MIEAADLVTEMRHLEGPVYRSDHPFMLKEGRPPLKIPNPHREDVSIDLLAKILRQAGISRQEWLGTR